MHRLSLSPQHVKFLAKRGISEKEALALGYRTVTTLEGLRSFQFEFSDLTYVPGLIIPLRSVEGNQPYFQYRPDVLHGKRKYLIPANVQHIIHVPSETARLLSEDPSLQILVTEGPIKADAAALRGIPCVSIQGVDCFSREKKLLPDWKALLSPGRVVVIVFDSDARHKPEVRSAALRFQRMLKAEGVEAKLLIFEPNGAEKVGLDDHLSANPDAGLSELLEMASDTLPGAATERESKQAKDYGPLGVLTLLEDVKDRKYPPWDFPGYVRQGGLMNIYAPGGGTKTLLLASMVGSKAAGAKWLGLKSPPAFCVYLAFEDYIGTAQRIAVYVDHYGLEERARGRIALLNEQSDVTLNLLEPESVGLLLRSFDLLPEKPGFVVVDSIGLAIGGADERDEATGRLLAAQCQRIQNYRWRADSTDPEVRKTDSELVTVTLAHHENRAGGYGGTHRFRDFVDSMFQISAMAGGLYSLGGEDPKANKQRHGPLPKPLMYGLLEADPVNQIAVVVPAGQAPINLNSDLVGGIRMVTDAIHAAAKPLRHSELERATGLKGGTFDRALETGQAKQYLRKTEDGAYDLTPNARACYASK